MYQRELSQTNKLNISSSSSYNASKNSVYSSGPSTPIQIKYTKSSINNSIDGNKQKNQIQIYHSLKQIFNREQPLQSQLKQSQIIKNILTGLKNKIKSLATETIKKFSSPTTQTLPTQDQSHNMPTKIFQYEPVSVNTILNETIRQINIQQNNSISQSQSQESYKRSRCQQIFIENLSQQSVTSNEQLSYSNSNQIQGVVYQNDKQSQNLQISISSSFQNIRSSQQLLMNEKQLDSEKVNYNGGRKRIKMESQGQRYVERQVNQKIMRIQNLGIKKKFPNRYFSNKESSKQYEDPFLVRNNTTSKILKLSKLIRKKTKNKKFRTIENVKQPQQFTASRSKDKKVFNTQHITDFMKKGFRKQQILQQKIALKDQQSKNIKQSQQKQPSFLSQQFSQPSQPIQLQSKPKSIFSNQSIFDNSNKDQNQNNLNDVQKSQIENKKQQIVSHQKQPVVVCSEQKNETVQNIIQKKQKNVVNQTQNKQGQDQNKQEKQKGQNQKQKPKISAPSQNPFLSKNQPSGLNFNQIFGISSQSPEKKHQSSNDSNDKISFPTPTKLIPDKTKDQQPQTPPRINQTVLSHHQSQGAEDSSMFDESQQSQFYQNSNYANLSPSSYNPQSQNQSIPSNNFNLSQALNSQSNSSNTVYYPSNQSNKQPGSVPASNNLTNSLVNVSGGSSSYSFNSMQPISFFQVDPQKAVQTFQNPVEETNKSIFGNNSINSNSLGSQRKPSRGGRKKQKQIRIH